MEGTRRDIRTARHTAAAARERVIDETREGGGNKVLADTTITLSPC